MISASKMTSDATIEVVQRYLVKTFGCRASQADGAAIEGGLRAKGMQPAGSPEDADLVVLNTCTVTSTADDELRQTVRRIHRRSPDARILLTGCYAQRAPEELAAIDGVSFVVGNSHKTRIPDLVDPAPTYHGEIPGEIPGSQVWIGDISRQQEFLAAPIEDALGDRTRPNLKIQDGCSNKCSFCIIPSVRGRSRSANPDQVVAEVGELAQKYREVVLTGINLGRWGRDLGEGPSKGKLRLADLVERLLDETGVQRLRLSSVEPMDFSDRLLELMATSGRIARHVHAPLQSGSDTVLRRMFRKYRPKHYRNRIENARALMPDCAVGADVMTGFPGETEVEFEESRAFIESLPFTYLHVFTYSSRPGTRAESAPDHIPLEVKKERTHILRELAARKNRAFRESMVGRRLSVVTIQGGRTGVSDNYLKVELNGSCEENQLVEVAIGGLTKDGLHEAGMLPVLS